MLTNLPLLLKAKKAIKKYAKATRSGFPKAAAGFDIFRDCVSKFPVPFENTEFNAVFTMAKKVVKSNPKNIFKKLLKCRVFPLLLLFITDLAPKVF